MDLWTIWMNAQINHGIAVDARGCGKVDNRTAQSCQAAAFRGPRGTPVLPRRVSQRVKAPDRRQHDTGRCIAVQDALKGPRDVLADVLAVFGSDSGLQWGDVAARLASRFPNRWDGAGADMRWPPNAARSPCPR
jgi:pimeloyl-ACP methyl ester carboxylesterase